MENEQNYIKEIVDLSQDASFSDLQAALFTAVEALEPLKQKMVMGYLKRLVKKHY